jgi:predicted RNA-binding Zn-ribbon protein involved in translation (DUF1610 family)
MTKTYECSKCGVVSESKEHLCQPQEVAGLEEYCGTNPDRDICDEMHEAVSFECRICGRAAESKELLCDAHRTKQTK